MDRRLTPEQLAEAEKLKAAEHSAALSAELARLKHAEKRIRLEQFLLGLGLRPGERVTADGEIIAVQSEVK